MADIWEENEIPLPDEVLVEIVGHLSIVDVARFSMVCRQFYRLGSDSFLRLSILERRADSMLAVENAKSGKKRGLQDDLYARLTALLQFSNLVQRVSASGSHATLGFIDSDRIFELKTRVDDVVFRAVMTNTSTSGLRYTSGSEMLDTALAAKAFVVATQMVEWRAELASESSYLIRNAMVVLKHSYERIIDAAIEAKEFSAALRASYSSGPAVPTAATIDRIFGSAAASRDELQNVLNAVWEAGIDLWSALDIIVPRAMVVLRLGDLVSFAVDNGLAATDALELIAGHLAAQDEPVMADLLSAITSPPHSVDHRDAEATILGAYADARNYEGAYGFLAVRNGQASALRSSEDTFEPHVPSLKRVIAAACHRGDYGCAEEFGQSYAEGWYNYLDAIVSHARRNGDTDVVSSLTDDFYDDGYGW